MQQCVCIACVPEKGRARSPLSRVFNNMAWSPARDQALILHPRLPEVAWRQSISQLLTPNPHTSYSSWPPTNTTMQTRAMKSPKSVRHAAFGPCASSPLSSDASLVDHSFEKRQIAWQFGCIVSLIQPNLVLKQGAKVRPAELRAMRLVQEHTPDIPIPRIRASEFRFEKNGIPWYGALQMEYIPGKTLEAAWAEHGKATQHRVCQDIWDLIARIRTIPRPDDLAPGLYRTADGSPSRDPLLGCNNDIAARELDDDSLRNRIYTRYVNANGLSYRDCRNMPDLLPRSTTSVFAHGDINPRNIMVDNNCRIIALLDWESSGWFPDYWEYAQMMKFCSSAGHEWQQQMEKSKPEPWDITIIQKARRVLF